MSMTFAELVGRIAEIGVDFRASRDHNEIVVAVPTQHYVDPHDGEKSMLLHVMLQEEGRMLRICVPEVYAMSAFTNRGAMCEAMLAANWRVRVTSYVLDESDGEVRVVCDLPLEDGAVTSAQISRMLTLVAWTVDQFDPVIRKAGADGHLEQTADALGEGRGREEARAACAAAFEIAEEPVAARRLVLERIMHLSA
jgi:hypothetical protein